MILLLDPLFLLVYWPEHGIVHDFAEYFTSAHYTELFFLYLNTTLVYFSFSGVRIWKRIGYGHAKIISSNWIDWSLTIGMGVFVIFFIIVGIYDLIHADKLGLEFLIGGTIVLCFLVFDMFTLILPTRFSHVPWWILHMTKMFLVWAALISALWLRIRVYVLPEDYIDIHFHTGTILWLTLTLIGYLVYRRHFQKKHLNL